jgi:hypothetical protein
MNTLPKWTQGLLGLVLWLAVVGLTFSIGYWSIVPNPSSSKITLGKLPTIPPDETLLLDLWAERPEYIVNKEELALVTEKNPREIDHVRFLCPRRPNEMSHLDLQFPLAKNASIKSAYLKLDLLAASVYDPSAKLRVYISSEATQGQFEELAELSLYTGEDQIPEDFDVTQFVKNSTSLKVRISCMASKLLYHPTPDDPIGYAAAQALRQPRNEKFAAKLSLWYRTDRQP